MVLGVLALLGLLAAVRETFEAEHIKEFCTMSVGLLVSHGVIWIVGGWLSSRLKSWVGLMVMVVLGRCREVLVRTGW